MMGVLPVSVPIADLSADALPKDLEKACRSLEEAFATLVFRKMHEAMVPKSNKGSSGFARETTQSMLDAQWAHLSSQGEGLGLWRTLYRQLESAEIKSRFEKVDEKPLKEPLSRALEGRGRGLYGGQSRSPITEQTSGLGAADSDLLER